MSSTDDTRNMIRPVEEWMLDTAATRHITPLKGLIHQMKPIKPFLMHSAFKHTTTVDRSGTVTIHHNVQLKNVAYVRGASANLISAGQIIDAGYNILLTKDKAEVIHARTKNIVLTIPRINGLWSLRRSHKPTTDNFRLLNDEDERKETHQRRIPRKMTKRQFTANGTAPTNTGSSNGNNDDTKTDPKASRQSTRNKTAVAATVIDSDSEHSECAMAVIEQAAANAAQSQAVTVTSLVDDVSHVKQSDNIAFEHARHWHRTLAHPSHKVLANANKVLALGIPNHALKQLEQEQCETCVASKLTRTVIGTQVSDRWRANAPGDVISVDLMGPMTSATNVTNKNGKKERVPSFSGFLYMMLVVDNATGHITGVPLKNKADAANELIKVLKQLQLTLGTTVKRLHSDGGREFVNETVINFVNSQGTIFTHTTANTPQHNGVSERANRTILNKSRSLRHDSKAPVRLWTEAMMYAIFIYNHTPRSNGATPYHLFTGNNDSSDYLVRFGCDAYVKTDSSVTGKLDDRGVLGIFTGVDATTNSYRVVLPDSGKLIRSRDVQFLPKQFTAMARLNNNIELLSSTSVATEIKPTVTASSDDLTDSDSDSDNDSHSEDDGDQSADFQPSCNVTDMSPPTSTTDSELTPTMPANQLPSTQVTGLRRSGRVTKQTSRMGMFHRNDFEIAPGVTKINFACSATESSNDVNPKLTSAIGMPTDITEPATYEEARKSPYWKHWYAAMQKEVNAIQRQGAYEIVPRPKGTRVVSGRWVYKLKRNANNEPVSFKGRWVARGFTQEYGVDYFDTFSPVIRYKSVKLLLRLAAMFGYHCKHLDYTSAFVHAPLTETVYVEQIHGFSDNVSNHVCRLNKALYGLKQSPLAWNTELDSYLKKLGYQSLSTDRCIYIKRTDNGRMIMLMLYVDDTVVAYHPVDEQRWLSDQHQLSNKYELNDLGEVHHLLGMEITRTKDGDLNIAQSGYIDKLLERHQMQQCRGTDNPASTQQLTKVEPDADISRTLDDKKAAEYRSIVGGLMFAAQLTRVDIAWITGLLGRYMQKPLLMHYNAAVQVLRYLASTKHHGLLYPRAVTEHTIHSVTVTGYTDSDWGGDLGDRKSTSGTVILINNCPVSWVSKKQKSVSLSTAEAEYYALSETAKECEWYRQTLRELFQEYPTISVLCDNNAAVRIAHNTDSHDRSKHIDIRYHFVRDVIAKKHITLDWIETKKQLADLLTKRLATDRFTELRDQLLVQSR